MMINFIYISRTPIMLRQTSSRNNRSKGFKLKSGLQVFLLLAVCIWLLYQVKRSHDKKKIFDENHAKILFRMGDMNEILKLGRKDLNHEIEMAIEREKHGKVEESIGDDELEESKEEEIEDEGRGGGDDEIDERDQEKAEEQAELGEEDPIDEDDREEGEEENEEAENIENEENKEDTVNEDMGSSKDHDNDRHRMNSQVSREERNNGDDASRQTIRKVENGVSGRLHLEESENIQMDGLNGANTNRTEFNNIEQRDSSSRVSELPIVSKDAEKIDNLPTNVTIDKEMDDQDRLSEMKNESPTNSTTAEPNDKANLYSNSDANSTEAPGSLRHNQTIILDNETNNMDKLYQSIQLRDHRVGSI